MSKAESDEKIGEFWDSHDFTEFDTDSADVAFEVISTGPAKLIVCGTERGFQALSDRENA